MVNTTAGSASVWGFNPLDRGNLNQMLKARFLRKQSEIMFQSPRSGKFESNELTTRKAREVKHAGFNPLDRGNLNQITLTKLFVF